MAVNDRTSKRHLVGILHVISLMFKVTITILKLINALICSVSSKLIKTVLKLNLLFIQFNIRYKALYVIHMGEAVNDRNLKGIYHFFNLMSMGTRGSVTWGVQSSRGAWPHIGQVSFCSGVGGSGCSWLTLILLI